MMLHGCVGKIKRKARGERPLNPTPTVTNNLVTDHTAFTEALLRSKQTLSSKMGVAPPTSTEYSWVSTCGQVSRFVQEQKADAIEWYDHFLKGSDKIKFGTTHKIRWRNLKCLMRFDRKAQPWDINSCASWLCPYSCKNFLHSQDKLNHSEPRQAHF